MATSAIPRHLAIAPDGNGRWARMRGLRPHEGHLAGVRPIADVIEACIDIGVEYVTFQIFTTENWGRSKEEVDKLFEAIESKLETVLLHAMRTGSRIRWIGRRDRVPGAIREKVTDIEKQTAENQAITVSFCMDYGSHQEMIAAIQSIVAEPQQIYPQNIDKAYIDAKLQTAGLPDVDLFVRSSGEQRFSNYLLWQSAYAEMYFTQKLWPDFSVDDLHAAMKHYSTRHRRFGTARYSQE